ncbi:MAG: 16S rRNA (cytosine(967)-C(5))-methyltransferase RsmB [Gammaproteobacteria bacterium]|nr:16S rRNA (cytosine(967)-C(5))-methyltransferase RsmB [Gammaproteobacteria bacterium]
MPTPVSDTARAIAQSVRALHEVITTSAHLDSAISKHVTDNQPLCQQLCYGALREYYSLCYSVTRHLDKPLPGKHHDILLLLVVGAYQIKEMHIGSHAAVNETVNAAVLLKKPWAKGLANAVLRKVAKQPHATTPPEDSQAAHNHPQWLARRIVKAWPDQATAILAANNLRAPLSLRVNLSRITRDAYQQKLMDAGLDSEKGLLSPACLILTRAVSTRELPGFLEGLVSVQDQAAQLAALLLDPQPGQRILDACAAPGGKCCHLLEISPQLGELVALEKDRQRSALIKDNLSRLGQQCKLEVSDLLEYQDQKGFHGILLDVPCSATGIIRRHPDIRFHRREEDIAAFSHQQRDLLTHAWGLLKPGGALLYCTCSILPEENQRVIEGFLQQTPAAALKWAQQGTPTWGMPSAHGITLLPGMAQTDGFFYARLVKKGATGEG